MEHNHEHGFGTKAIHAGQIPDPTTGAIMTPIYQTSTYVQKSPGVIVGEYDYSRAANPTRTAIEANIAALEGGKHGLCFSSGVAATSDWSTKTSASGEQTGRDTSQLNWSRNQRELA